MSNTDNIFVKVGEQILDPHQYTVKKNDMISGGKVTIHDKIPTGSIVTIGVREDINSFQLPQSSSSIDLQPIEEHLREVEDKAETGLKLQQQHIEDHEQRIKHLEDKDQTHEQLHPVHSRLDNVETTLQTIPEQLQAKREKIESLDTKTDSIAQKVDKLAVSTENVCRKVDKIDFSKIEALDPKLIGWFEHVQNQLTKDALGIEYDENCDRYPSVHLTGKLENEKARLDLTPTGSLVLGLVDEKSFTNYLQFLPNEDIYINSELFVKGSDSSIFYNIARRLMPLFLTLLENRTAIRCAKLSVNRNVGDKTTWNRD